MATIDIIPQRTNANKHTQRGMGELERSIQEDGWIGAITVAADGETFDGSARVKTLATAGLREPLIIDNDGTQPIVIRRTDIASADDERAKRLAIAANKIAADNLDWDAGVLAALSEEMDLSGMFRVDEMAKILEAAGTEIISANELWKGMPEFEQPGVKTYKDIIVHFKTQEDYEEFARLINQTLTPHTQSVWYPERPEELKGQTNKSLVFTHEEP